MRKLSRILENYRTISFVGNSKNAGKTTVINHLLKHYEGKRIAITSIGLDGEKIDQVTFMEKPRIFVRSGDYVATAEKTLDAFEATYEILQDTHIRTAIGPILIVQIKTAGNALVAGPSAVSSMQRILDILNDYNPEKVLVDGAFFRHTLARISEATVYIVGSNLSQDIDKVVDDALLNVKKFDLSRPAFSTDFLDEIKHICAFDHPEKIALSEFDSVLGNAEKIISSEFGKSRFLYLPKSLTNVFVEKMVENRSLFRPDLIVDSPVSIQLSYSHAKQLFKLPNKVYVRYPINLVAVCYNPFSPKGYTFDDEQFKLKLEAALGRAVINVEKEVSYE